MEDSKKGPRPKSERKQRRQQILAFMEEHGPYSVPTTELSEKWKCSRQTIHKDINFLISKIDIKGIDKEGKKLLYTIRQNIQLAEKLRLRGKDKDRLKAMEIANKSAELLTRLMEQYGFKEKIADKLDFSGLPTTFNLIEKSMEEIKHEKAGNKSGPQSSDKSKANGDTESSR
ncbi:hypothetical protein LCGC14_2037810 [marine sediment metagenome]|uniref:Helix-turn-helix type 11 domain-containing protein n=1 Tax=marine sediment metagenome TaxID=412755 RepID=A0A0F9ESZ2_9ZZZZ